MSRDVEKFRARGGHPTEAQPPLDLGSLGVINDSFILLVLHLF